MVRINFAFDLQYRVGQLYMIARHSHEQSDSDEGVEVVENTACEDPTHGKGQYTEKRIHLSRYRSSVVQSYFLLISFCFDFLFSFVSYFCYILFNVFTAMFIFIVNIVVYQKFCIKKITVHIFFC